MPVPVTLKVTPTPVPLAALGVIVILEPVPVVGVAPVIVQTYTGLVIPAVTAVKVALDGVKVF